jgi:hypothetical protein
MFVCFLLGGMGLALTVGLLDVLVLHADALKTQGHTSGGLDLALGIPLLAVGALLATDHLHRRRRRYPAEHRPPSKLAAWVHRVLQEPRFGLAVIIGAVVGSPGVQYLAALHLLVNGTASTAVQVLAVVGFVVIEFALVIVPFAFLAVRPERTEKAINRAKEWLTSHERQIAAAVALLAGIYMVISGTLRVLG